MLDPYLSMVFSLSLRWLTAGTVTFFAFVFPHWPITVFCDEVIRRIGFVTFERTVAAAMLIIGVVAAGAAALNRNRLRALRALRPTP